MRIAATIVLLRGKKDPQVYWVKRGDKAPFLGGFHAFPGGLSETIDRGEGEDDPVVDFTAKLRKTSEPENWRLAKKLSPKLRIFAPVIVRGEEDKGVRLWQFGKIVYEELLALALDDEIGDYTDIVNGRDLTIETVGPESTGTPYNKSSVRVRLKSTPLSEDAKQVEQWTSEQPNPNEGLFKKFTFDEMKVALEKWLSPEVEEDAEEVVETVEVEEGSEEGGE